MARKKDLGTTFQDDTQSYLDTLQKTGRLRYVRLYDTKSARVKYLPPSPGDFIVAAVGGGHLLECKASEVHDSLAGCVKSAVRPHQAASHRLWAKTGNPCWFLFYSQPRQVVELWRGDLVGEAYAGLRKLDLPEIEVSIASLLELLQMVFIGPIKEI